MRNEKEPWLPMPGETYFMSYVICAVLYFIWVRIFWQLGIASMALWLILILNFIFPVETAKIAFKQTRTCAFSICIAIRG